MNEYMQIAIEEARLGIRSGHGGPFGCVIVKDGKIVGKGHNEVVLKRDSTCHGEMMAIRDACKTLNSFDLSDCELYTTAEPCPMCLSAAMWANISKIYYGCTIDDTEKIGFRDKKFYGLINNNSGCIIKTDRNECLKVFEEYRNSKDKIDY